MLARRWHGVAFRRLGWASYSTPHSQSCLEQSTPSVLRVGVLGLGAIGTIFFTRLGQLASASKQLTLHVDGFVKPQHFNNWAKSEQLQLTLQSHKSQDETLQFAANGDAQAAVANHAPNVRVCTLESTGSGHYERLDVLLVAVKAYDSVETIRELRERHRHLLREDALCVLLQNGLGELPAGQDEALRVNPADRWQFVNGVTYVGGRVLSFGNVLTSGLDAGMTYLAPFQISNASQAEEDLQQRDAKIDMLTQILLAAGIHCEVLESSKMQEILWRKLIVNAAINPLASLLDSTNACVASSEASRHCVNMIVQEALAVALSEGVSLSCTQNELVEEVLTVARNTGSNVCSMLADLRRGSRTEIDAITGRIIAGGRRHGISTPTNELLLSLVKALEEEGVSRVL